MAGGALDNLPFETTIEIASYLSDEDICALSATCKTLHNIVIADGSPLWRRLLAQQFDGMDMPLTNNAMRSAYQQRKSVLHRSRYGSFTDGNRASQKEALMVLRDMVVESFNSVNPGEASKNLTLLRDFCRRSSILDHVLEPKYEKKRRSLLVVVQVLLSHFRLDLSFTNPTFGFPTSQAAMYAAPFKRPIFCGRDRLAVDLAWVLHAFNFFRYYMTVPCMALEHAYRQLERKEQVQPWTRKIREGASPLGKSWKGAYGMRLHGRPAAYVQYANGDIAYLDDDEIIDIRGHQPSEDIEDRWCDNEDVFQTLEVETLAPGDPTMAWPDCFERHTHAKHHPSVRAMLKKQKAAEMEQEKKASTSGSSPISPTVGNAPQTRPKATRAQLKHNSKAVLDNGPETEDTRSVSPTQPTFDKTNIFNPVPHGPATPPLHTSKPTPTKPRDPILLPFTATGTDEEEFLATGYTSALPPQQGIPGWQRFTMMKFFVPDELQDDENVDLTDLEMIADKAIGVGLDGLWAYEGVVLPGGNAIVGRWWSPTSGDGTGLVKAVDGGDAVGVYSGPFVWWNVDVHCQD